MPATTLPFRRLPRIGMRMVKTSVVVFICFMIYHLRGQEGMPFYSVVAAIICVQTNIGNSFATAVDRTIGTFIGGAFGVLNLLLDRNLMLSRNYPLFNYIIISIVIIPLIYITVLIKRPNAAALTCVVYVGIAVSYGGDANSYLFALNRMIDTLIGIFVSLGVNALRPPVRAGRKILFALNLDDTLLRPNGLPGAASVVKLTQMLDNGAMITIVTNRSPAVFVPLLEGFRFRLPVITVNGAALFNMTEKRYENCKFIPQESVARIMALFESLSHTLFVSMIINEAQHIYYSGDFFGQAEEKLCALWRGLPGIYYIHSKPPDSHPVLYMTAAGTAEVIAVLKAEADQIAGENGVYTVCYPSQDISGIVIMELYSVGTSRKAAVLEMKEQLGAEVLVAAGSSEDDLPLMEAADVILAVSEADSRVKALANHVVGSIDSDSVARHIHRIFYWSRRRTVLRKSKKKNEEKNFE